MTVDEAIKLVDQLNPGNRFDNDMKTLWLSEIEGQAFEELRMGDDLLARMAPPEFAVRHRTSRLLWWRNGYHWTNDLFEKIKKAKDKFEQDIEEKQPEAEDTSGSEGSPDKTDEDKDCQTHYAEQIDPLNMGSPIPWPIYHELRGYKYERDKDAQLIAPDRFSDVYVHYVIAKMHAADGEIEEYNNEVILHTASYQNFCGWYIRNHPSRGYKGYLF